MLNTVVHSTPTNHIARNSHDAVSTNHMHIRFPLTILFEQEKGQFHIVPSVKLFFCSGILAIYSTLKNKVQNGAKRIRSCFSQKTLETHEAAGKEVAIADRSLNQNDLSICSDSSSLWNVTRMSFGDVFDLSLESNQDAWTVNTMALDAILRNI